VPTRPCGSEEMQGVPPLPRPVDRTRHPHTGCLFAWRGLHSAREGPCQGGCPVVTPAKAVTVDLREIKAVKMTCGHCGAGVEVSRGQEMLRLREGPGPRGHGRLAGRPGRPGQTRGPDRRTYRDAEGRVGRASRNRLKGRLPAVATRAVQIDACHRWGVEYVPVRRSKYILRSHWGREPGRARVGFEALSVLVVGRLRSGPRRWRCRRRVQAGPEPSPNPPMGRGRNEAAPGYDWSGRPDVRGPRLGTRNSARAFAVGRRPAAGPGRAGGGRPVRRLQVVDRQRR